jgi:two-component system, sensor histidine kinase
MTEPNLLSYEIENSEAAVRAATSQLEIVTECMAAPVTRCSRELTYLWVSKPYANWIGRRREEIISQPIIEVIGREGFDRLRPHFERVLSGEKVQYEETIPFKGLGPRWINGQAAR